jgi:hypothetical protein
LFVGKKRAFRVGAPFQAITSGTTVWRAARYASGNRVEDWHLACISRLSAAH